MAGHSKWANIRHRKGAQDAKRGKIFTKIIRELTVAAKAGGDDPDSNPRLRAAITTARGSNMPKDTMERAIKRGAGGDDSVNYEEIRYEGYGPGGTALIVEALTDNRNRTASEVRSSFTKYGGNLGESNSVTFMFDRKGLIEYDATVASQDDMFEVALEAGADHVEFDEEAGHQIFAAVEDFSTARDALTEKYGDPRSARLTWIPQNTVDVNEAHAQTLLKLVDILEDNDDVQTVSSNFEISEEILEKLNV